MMDFVSEMIRKNMLSTRHLPTFLPVFLFVVTAAMGAAGLSHAVMILYPLGAMAIGLLLVNRHPASFIAFLLWLLFLTTLLRRVVDLHAGYSQTNPMMLAPYMVAITMLPTVIFHVLSTRIYATPFLIMFVCLGFGTVMVLLDNRILSGGIEAMRWLLPPVLAIYIISHAENVDLIHSTVAKTFFFGVMVLSAYGVCQFTMVPAWDKAFMLATTNETIGKPYPFQVRVFGTMNSPGSLATALATGILLLTICRFRGRWIITGVGLAVLMLTQQRAAIGAFCVAVVALIFISPIRLMSRFMTIITLCICVAGIIFAIPDVRSLLYERLSSTIDLSDDVSAQVRLEQYAIAPTWIEEAPLGHGFGWASALSRLDGNKRIHLDSGILHIFIALGIPAALGFIFSLVILVCEGVYNGLSAGIPQAKVEIAIAVLGISQLPFGMTYAGEFGFLLWLSIGLLLARSTRFITKGSPLGCSAAV